ncbi:hypothetical protein [Mycobacterium sp. 852002-51613_SCH5001154]|nr:hypothetical protein [Mycobacterium sp. 852002-51613_SCH5001154]
MCFSITADLVLVHMLRRRRLPDPHRYRGRHGSGGVERVICYL